MKYNIESDLIANEIGYLKPVRSTWKTLTEDAIGALLIAAFVAIIIWIASY